MEADCATFSGAPVVVQESAMIGVGRGAELLEGTLDRIVYRNEETHWTIGRLEITGRPETVPVVGKLTGVQAGTTVAMVGRWVVHRTHGEQFEVESHRLVVPATTAGIERYLGSGLVPGIGPELAKRIVDKFGPQTLEVIEAQPERLVEVDGIGRVRAERIRAGLGEQRAVQEVMVFLQGHGVSAAYAVRIHKAYGSAAIGIVSANPYRLALDIWGIGFKTADAIARSLGVGKDSPARAEAGILHVLGKLVEDGHTHAPEHAVLAAAEQTIEVGAEQALPAVDRLDFLTEPCQRAPAQHPQHFRVAPLSLQPARAEIPVDQASGCLQRLKGFPHQ